MKINDAVARLVRAGDDNSAMWQKLHEAIDEIAKTLAKYFPGGGAMNCIAKQGDVAVWFQHWPSGEYTINMGIANPYSSLTRDSKGRESVLDFCRMVTRHGLLDKISKKLEEQTSELTKGYEGVAKFIVDRK